VSGVVAISPSIPDTDQLFGHPRGLAYIVFTEAWERFSFYGMQALLVLYMAGYLLQPGNVDAVIGFAGYRAFVEGIFGPLPTQALATQTFGLYAGFVYLTPIFGGLLGDRVLGRTRAVTLGAAVMVAGHFLMAFEAAFLFAILLLLIGCGLLKGNLAAQVGGLYDRDDPRRDRAFSIYYVGVNLGAFVAPLICGTLGELYGWHYGFTAAGVGMLIGLCIYLAGRRHLPIDVKYAAGEAPRLAPGDGRIVIGLLVVLLLVALFWVAQTQVWNTYPLWVRDRVDRDLFGLTVPITWFQSIDTLAVLLFAPLIMLFWRRQGARGGEPQDLTKVAIGCAVFAGACLWLAAGELLTGSGRVSMLWSVLFHLTCAAGYLYVVPIALALFARAAPDAVNALMVSIYYIGIFLGSIASGWLGRFYGAMPSANFWALHAAIVGTAAVMIFALRAPLVRQLKLAPR
jgi:POT family proton-dependent oligopeptide transporter